LTDTRGRLDMPDDVEKDVEITSANFLRRLYPSTVGRIGTVASLPVYQESIYRDFDTLDEGEARKIVEDFKKRHPDELGGLAVRLGASRPWDDAKRAWTSSRSGVLSKIMAPAAFLASGASNTTRSSHYNPYSDSVTVFGNYPEVLAHELGHAVDINKKMNNRSGRVGRDAYMAAYIGSGAAAGALSPMTLWTEGAANYRAGQAMDAPARRRARRILYPAISTYGTAAVVAGLALHHNRAQNKKDTPFARLNKLLDKGTPDFIKKHRPAEIMYKGMLSTVPGALLARVVAELVNTRDQEGAHE